MNTEEENQETKADSLTNSQKTVSSDDEIDYSTKPEFYDPKLDNKDQVWVQKRRKGQYSDAVLSCPACFNTLCLECQSPTTAATEKDREKEEAERDKEAWWGVGREMRETSRKIRRRRGRREREIGRETEAEGEMIAGGGGEAARPVKEEREETGEGSLVTSQM
ncbi:hypothetical protein ACET3Z_029905 [Daucus carota]